MAILQAVKVSITRLVVPADLPHLAKVFTHADISPWIMAKSQKGHFADVRLYTSETAQPYVLRVWKSTKGKVSIMPQKFKGTDGKEVSFLVKGLKSLVPDDDERALVNNDLNALGLLIGIISR